MKLKPPRPPQKPKTRSKSPNPYLGLTPDLSFETQAGHPSVLVAGIDEVGRGCLAGPVVAAAVVLPKVVDWEGLPWLRDVADSKLLDEKERDRLAPLIREWAPLHAVGEATVEEIDQINIFHASHLAMVRAFEKLQPRPKRVLVDGKFLPKEMQGIALAVVKGDLRCLSIACASILAKVHRDQMLHDFEKTYPGYGFAIHKGYPTPAHQKALRELGVTEIHRRSFGPVAAVLSLAKE